MKNTRLITALIAIFPLSLVATPTNATESVSPGALDRMAQVNNACPTFSWGEDDGAQAYEIIGYVLPEGIEQQEELSPEREVLYTRVTGLATGWTPSTDQCFAPGGNYVWFVRSVTEMIDDQVIEAGEWSQGRYFSVPAGPSVEEVARAVEVLKQWEAQRGGGEVSPSPAGKQSGGASPTLRRSSWGNVRSDSDAGSAAPKSVPTASAAVRGEHPDTTSEAYGLVGTSASPGGAGVAAANLGGGADLVLDGSADGSPDIRVSESGIYMDASGDRVFEVKNSGEGSLSLDVNGHVLTSVVEAGRLDVGGSTVIDFGGNWLGVGEVLPCPGCVGSSDIADGGVGTADLADGAVEYQNIAIGHIRTGHLQNQAVTTEKLHDDAVTSQKIVNGTVIGDDIADGTVTHRDLATDSVRGSHIRNGDVTTADLADGSVTSLKIGALAVNEGNIMDWAVSTDKIEPGAVIGSKLADDAVWGATIADGAVSSNHIQSGTITAADVNPTGGVYASKLAVYEATVTENVSGGSLCDTATAECADANDLPLSSFCSPAWSNDLILKDSEVVYWDNETAPAGFSCSYCNYGSSTESFEVHIICISVPGT